MNNTQVNGGQFIHGEPCGRVVNVCAWCAGILKHHPSGNYYLSHAPAECLGRLTKKLRIRTAQAIRCGAGFHKWAKYGHPSFGFGRYCETCHISEGPESKAILIDLTEKGSGK